MTTTDIGILLVVLCILLWAIMAALHRHTVQLDALRKDIQALRNARDDGLPRPDGGASERVGTPANPQQGNPPLSKP